MILECVFCKNVLPVPDVSFKTSVPNIICPICKKKFKPDLSARIEKTVLITSKSRPKAFLIYEENGVKRQYELEEKRQVIGRKSEQMTSDIMIVTTDKTMSRRHFYIDSVEENNDIFYYISNADNKNSTLINKKNLKREEKIKLKAGDIIYAGQTKLTFIQT